MRCPLSPATGRRERTTAPAAYRSRPVAAQWSGRRKQRRRTSRPEPHASVLDAPRQSGRRRRPELRRDEQQAAVHKAGARDIRSVRIAKSMRNVGWFAGIFNAIFQSFAARQGKRLWCEKSLQNMQHMEKLAHAFSHAKFIHIIRDGRDCAASLHQRWRRTAKASSVFDGGMWIEDARRQRPADGRSLFRGPLR